MEIGISEAIQHFFSTPSFDLIYSEALANALDAGARNIGIFISLHSFSEPNTLEITINDDGEGFSENNFAKFSKLLSKSDSSHKGLGRLIYLKYFSKVYVESVFDKNNKRTFIFVNTFKGESNIEKLDSDIPSYSKLTFKS
ncbi:MAG: sensor histidine kinase, partial [Treponema sp.]|nr:sensor histidine kinase [Treponema sp.]